VFIVWLTFFEWSELFFFMEILVSGQSRVAKLVFLYNVHLFKFFFKLRYYLFLPHLSLLPILGFIIGKKSGVDTPSIQGHNQI